ncbi:MAG: NAD(P)-dependent dehydrogenase (short-subunit alcohol dehydrogenase family) [Halieaceae bacterium]|jgi:NAD(P)-dependent dehydrogenase (short-subunit alcohol dehydrogenase family)
MIGRDRVAVVTGASSGIGLEIAKALASMGWRIIAAGRNPARCASAETEIRSSATVVDVTMLQADLALMGAATALAEQITGLTDRIDILINNAGGMTSDLTITADGLESCFAGNHLGPFLLTNRLLPLLRRTAAELPAGSVRIINTSSDGSEMIPRLNFADLQNLESFSPGAAYCSAKLANVMFARGLAQRLADDGILAFSVHPGTVASNFVSHVPDSTRQYIETLESITPAEGANTLIWLATTAPELLESGGYYCKRKLREENPHVQVEHAIDQLWIESEKLIRTTGFDGSEPPMPIG